LLQKTFFCYNIDEAIALFCCIYNYRVGQKNILLLEIRSRPKLRCTVTVDNANRNRIGTELVLVS